MHSSVAFADVEEALLDRTADHEGGLEVGDWGG